MKKLLNILEIIGLISTSGGTLVSCNGEKPPQYSKKMTSKPSGQIHNNINNNNNNNNNSNNSKIKNTMNLLRNKLNQLNQKIGSPNTKINIQKNKELQNDVLQLKEKIQKLETELKRVDFRNIKKINLLDLKIKANDIEKVKESEIRPYLEAEILTEIQKINKALTKNDFAFNFNDYFNNLQPREINLSKPINQYIINIEGYNNAKGNIKLRISLPQASYRVINFANFKAVEIPSVENKLPNFPDGYFSTILLFNKIKTQFLAQIKKINPDLNQDDFKIVFNTEPYKSKMDNLKNVYICSIKNLDKCSSQDSEFNITITGKNKAKGEFTTIIKLEDFYKIK